MRNYPRNVSDDDFNRALEIVDRIKLRRLKKIVMQEEEERKRRELDKKKKDGPRKNFTRLEWFLLLIITYPFVGPWYLELILQSLEKTKALLH